MRGEIPEGGDYSIPIWVYIVKQKKRPFSRFENCKFK